MHLLDATVDRRLCPIILLQKYSLQIFLWFKLHNQNLEEERRGREKWWKKIKLHFLQIETYEYIIKLQW